MFALPPKADIGTQSRNVRFVPKTDIGLPTDHLAVTAERRNAHREIAISALAWPNGDDFMHFADYLVLGLLIACMLGAASVILSRRDS
jgi:hypothetical protein